ncbi:unnamed protein product [Sphagnum compactum]
MGQRNRSLFIQQLLENNYFDDEEDDDEEDGGIHNWESRATTMPLLRNQVQVVGRSSPDQGDKPESTAGHLSCDGEDKSTSGDNGQLGGGVKSDMEEESSEASSQDAVPQNSFLKIGGGSRQSSVAAGMINTSTSTTSKHHKTITVELSEDLDSTSGASIGCKDEVESKPSDIVVDTDHPSEDIMGQGQVGYQAEHDKKLERGKAFQNLELERGKGCQNLECSTSDSSASSSECSLSRRLSVTTDWIHNCTVPVAAAEVLSSKEAISTSFAESFAQEASITQCVKLLTIAHREVEDFMTESKVEEPAIAVTGEDKTVFTNNGQQNFFFNPLTAVEQSQLEIVSRKGRTNGLGIETPKSLEWKEEEPSLVEDSPIQHPPLVAENRVSENDEPEVAKAAPVWFKDKEVMEPDLNVWTGQVVVQSQGPCLELEVEKAVAIEEVTDGTPEDELKGSDIVVAENTLENTSTVETTPKLDRQSKALVQVEASFTRLEPQHELSQRESEEIVPMTANGTIVTTETIALEGTRAGGCGGGYLDKNHAATMRRCSLAAGNEHGMGHDTDIPQFAPPGVSILPDDREFISAPSLSNKSPIRVDHRPFGAGIGSDLEASPQLPFGYPLDHSQQAQLHSQILVFGAKQKRKVPADALTRTSVGTLRAVDGVLSNNKLLMPVEDSPIEAEVYERDLNPGLASMETTTIQQPLGAVLLEDLETASSESVQDDGKLENQLGWRVLSNSELERETPVQVESMEKAAPADMVTHGCTLQPLSGTTVNIFFPATMATNIAIPECCIMSTERTSSSEARAWKHKKIHSQKADNDMVLSSIADAEQQQSNISLAASAIALIPQLQTRVMQDVVQYEAFRDPTTIFYQDDPVTAPQLIQRQPPMDDYQMDKQLQQAQCLAQDAIISATTALTQTHYIWAQLQAQNPCNGVAVREAQFASLTATVMAAASINKAAAAAAKAIAEASNETLQHLALQQGQPSVQSLTNYAAVPQVLGFHTTHNQDYEASGRPMQVASGIHTRRCRSVKKRHKCKAVWPLKTLPKRVKDSISKRPAKVRQVKGFARRHRRGKPRMAGYRDVDSVIQEGRQLMFEKSSGRGPLRLMASTSQVTTTERLQLVKVGGVPNTSETIKPGSHVEVMSEEEGLRGGWFSAKVLVMKDKQALLLYDELLAEDGQSQLNEWLPVYCSQEEDTKSRKLSCCKQKKLRPVHPFCFSKARGLLKRPSVAMGSHVWLVGDHVDAFIQDGWWEGIVKVVNKDDKNQITVYFPGEKDTAVVKLQNLRPSMIWADGQWRSWKDLSVMEEYGHSSKRLKVRHGLAKGKVETQKYSKANLLKMTEIELSHHRRPRITRRTSKSKISRNLGAAQTKYTMSVRRNVLTSARKSRRLNFSSKKQVTVWAPPMRKNGLPHPNRLALVVATPLKECAKNFEELLTPLTQNRGEVALGRQTQRCLRSKVTKTIVTRSDKRQLRHRTAGGT